mmetsp:Transcript_71294/g.112966  ORF Transcript_71294/g.112966 Transcript_71294/m.112966 type:complete len:199 (-) Transcript_71294:80-676(-)
MGFRKLVLSTLLCGAVHCDAAEGVQSDSDMSAILSAALKMLPGNETGGCISGCQDALKPCLGEKDIASRFASAVRTAIDQMMMKRTKKMRRGVYHLASAVASLSSSAEGGCAKEITGLTILTESAKKLQSFTDKKGLVEYKALEKLVVSGVDIHKPLNKLIGAWKKDPVVAEDFGTALGEFIGLFKDATRQAPTSAEL